MQMINLFKKCQKKENLNLYISMATTQTPGTAPEQPQYGVYGMIVLAITLVLVLDGM